MSNKISIPWYRRNVKPVANVDDMDNPMSFNIPNIPKPKPTNRPKPQTEPVPEPVKSPVKVPADVPSEVPNPFPVQFPTKFPLPFPDNPFDKKFPLPIPIPEPKGNKPTVKNPIPVPTAFEKVAGTILKPIITLFALNEAKNQYIKVNVSDKIYNRMLADPVLGLALREAEKANLDAGSVGTYFANYDWDNFDANQMTKDLTLLVGAAGAARIIIFIIGRKVFFRI